MYDAFWGFSSRPFRDASGAGFMQTAAGEEALARLQYLVDQHYRLGILFGEWGVGKSVLLSVFDGRCRADNRDTCHMNLIGVGLDEFLLQVAQHLHIYETRSAADTWQRIFGQIQLNGYQQRDTVMLFDDVDQAEPEVLKAVRRLAQGTAQNPMRLTTILSVDSARTHRVDSTLFATASLRVEVWPWFREEVEAYLRHELDRAGCDRQPFSSEAIDRLFGISQGLPRHVGRLAELALAAAASEGCPHITSATIQAVANELQFALL